MSYENLLLEIRDSIAWLTINRPKVLNALNTKTVLELAECFLAIQQDEAARVLIVTGAGEKAFAAGADIEELAASSPQDARQCALRGQAMLGRLENLGKPSIAAINGFALGGGCELALACSFRIASDNARLGQPEVKLGIIPGWGGTQRLPRLIGKGMALQMILTGNPISAQDALQGGLVNQVVPLDQLLPTAEALAKKIIANAPLAIRYSLEAVHQGLNSPLEQGLALEGSLFGLSFATQDMKEGTRAFLEKRPAKFVGQ
ncbi:MAG: enoyl-CoA hydratase/isomerase family protein [Acidobacteria bacterium]|nr:enoyl-CoA hydratase/isomerase family protein [Acidobacteriota bacterium]